MDVVGVEEAGSASLEKLSGLNIDAKAAWNDVHVLGYTGKGFVPCTK